MNRKIKSVILIALCVIALIFGAQYATGYYIRHRAISPVVIQPTDIVLGSPKAPKTMAVVESLTCSHCQDWTRIYFPAFKESFLDTGKVRLVIRDFPLDTSAAQATLLVQCVPEQQRAQLHEDMLLHFQEWENDNATLREQREKELFHVTDEQLTCAQSKERYDALVKSRDTMIRDIHLIATPTFLIPPRALPGNDDQNRDDIADWIEDRH